VADPIGRPGPDPIGRPQTDPVGCLHLDPLARLVTLAAARSRSWRVCEGSERRPGARVAAWGASSVSGCQAVPGRAEASPRPARSALVRAAAPGQRRQPPGPLVGAWDTLSRCTPPAAGHPIVYLVQGRDKIRDRAYSSIVILSLHSGAPARHNGDVKRKNSVSRTQRRDFKRGAPRLRLALVLKQALLRHQDCIY
jgi:hypothetical protein